MRRGQIRIGISNVEVPGNKSTFPPEYREGSRLHYYGSLFNTVEINRSFYKTPLLSTCTRWCSEVPEDFQFTLKLSKEVTHAKELKGDLSLIDRFMASAAGIGSKKGCMLIQFPGKITLDYYEQVEEILYHLEAADPEAQWKKAVEFRHESWYTGETWEMLDEFNATAVLHDKTKSKMMEHHGRASFVYLRFHGPKGDYRDSYPLEFLEDRAQEIRVWSEEGKDVYVYFNNTIGEAFGNANTLKEILLKFKS